MNPSDSPRSMSTHRKRFPGLLAIVVSFLMMSVLGCTFIINFWGINRSLGLTRSVGFVVIIAGVHFVGYSAWLREPRSISTNRKRLPGLLAIVVSFLMMSVLGNTYLFNLGGVRSVGFVVIIAGVHFVGYSAWLREQKKSDETKRDDSSTSV